MCDSWRVLGAAVLLLACSEQRDERVVVVGENASSSEIPSLAVSAAGRIAVAWRYRAISSQAVRVATLEGGEWKQLDPDLSLAEGLDPSPRIAFQPDGTLLLETEEDWTSESPHPRVVVRRWSGAAWEELGGPDGPMGAGQKVFYGPRMAIDSLGAPVIAAVLIDAETGVSSSTIALRRWGGAAWAPLSSGDFVLDSNDRPVLLYKLWEEVRPGEFSYVSHVVRRDGSAWTHLPYTPASILDLALAPGDVPLGLLETKDGDREGLALARFGGPTGGSCRRRPRHAMPT